MSAPALPLFALGRREVSQPSEACLAAASLSAQSFFDRHARGDWGDVPDWLRTDNDRAASRPRYSHAIRSEYQFDDGRQLLVITATDRSRTRLMLADEYGPREVSAEEGYALWANAYDLPNPLIAVEEPVVNAILDALPLAERAIDVGTGTGRLAQNLARRGVKDILGIDATPEMLAIARESARRDGLDNVRFAPFTFGKEALPANDNSVDLLTCGLMLTHVPDLRGAIQECARVIRPGGWLLLSDFHPAVSAFGWRTDFVTPEAHYLLPNHPYTRQDYLDSLTKSGCDIREVHDIALGGEPYGDVSEAAVSAKGLPPLCLVILVQKQIVA